MKDDFSKDKGQKTVRQCSLLMTTARWKRTSHVKVGCKSRLLPVSKFLTGLTVELCICFESKPEKQGKAVKSQNTAQAEAVYLLMLDETSVPSSLYKGVDSGSGFLT